MSPMARRSDAAPPEEDALATVLGGAGALGDFPRLHHPHRATEPLLASVVVVLQIATQHLDPDVEQTHSVSVTRLLVGQIVEPEIRADRPVQPSLDAGGHRVLDGLLTTALLQPLGLFRGLRVTDVERQVTVRMLEPPGVIHRPGLGPDLSDLPGQAVGVD